MHFRQIDVTNVIGAIVVFDLAAGQDKIINVSVSPDTSELLPKNANAMRFLEQILPTANGEKIVFGARGEVLVFDVKTSEYKNLTNTSGAAERYPVISPDGKTIAYLIPLVAQMMEKKNVCGLVVVPTRELALQVISVYRKITNNQQNVAGVALVGGMPMGAQFRELAKNPKVIIATPGRLLDHCRRKPTLLRSFNYCVVDEADRMLDMGFEPQIRKIMHQIRRDRQVLMW